MDPHMLDGLASLAIIGIAAIVIFVASVFVGSGVALFLIVKALL